MTNRHRRAASCLPMLALIGHIFAPPTLAQEPCDVSEVFEPYSQQCAPVNDRTEWWLSPSEPSAQSVTLPIPDFQSPEQSIGPGKNESVAQAVIEDAPEAGAINVGTTYLNGALRAVNSARLHTKLFVYPDGIQPAGFLDWTFMPATNRVDSSVEVVAIYRTALGDSGVLSIFGRPCSLDYPCPDGDVSNGWQPSKYFTELTCNITHIVDEGGHAQKIVHYANHSDKIDDANPPLWNNSVYLWNYCDDQWDLIWQHTYRENKRDCSVDGCSWWGPGVELPGSMARPEVAELGYEDSLLFHDGTWSQLTPGETGFRRPEDNPQLSPWQLFHSNPNRAFGAGNYLDQNDPPTITAQQELTIAEDTDIQIGPSDVTINDPDIDPAFHSEFLMTVHNGSNYSHTDLTITPDNNFHGQLQVPVSVSDGGAESDTYTLLIDVDPVNDAPTFTSAPPTNVMEGASYIYNVEVIDVDNDTITIAGTVVPPWLTLTDRGDGTATLGGSPEGVDVGNHAIVLATTDNSSPIQEQAFTILVAAAPDAPQITILGSNPLTINQYQAYADAGATATDVQDGNLTTEISVTGAVNSSIPGTYRITYTVSDTAGNLSTALRTVTVRAPVEIRRSGGGSTSIPELLCWILAALLIHRTRRSRLG